MNNKNDLSAYVAAVFGEIRAGEKGGFTITKSGLYLVLELLQFYILHSGDAGGGTPAGNAGSAGTGGLAE